MNLREQTSTQQNTNHEFRHLGVTLNPEVFNDEATGLTHWKIVLD
jgi:hypothetical protein